MKYRRLSYDGIPIAKFNLKLHRLRFKQIIGEVSGIKYEDNKIHPEDDVPMMIGCPVYNPIAIRLEPLHK